MKLTLLQLVQDMLVAIDGEDIDTISDTEEAGMCAALANTCYEDMITSRRTWRHLRQYSALNTTARLNELALPDGTLALDPYHIWYNGTLLNYMSPENFYNMTVRRETDDNNVTTINGINVYTDRDPTYFTSVDDYTLVFDAIPSAINGLDGNDCNSILYKMPTSRITADDGVFDLPNVAFPALNLYCQAEAMMKLKGDLTGGGAKLSEYKKAFMRLAKLGNVIDVRNDLRKWIVPRSTSRRIVSPLRNAGGYFV